MVVSVGAPASTSVAHAHLAVAASGGGQVRVAVVIDFGPGSGMTPRLVVKCPKVPAGTSGASVLASVASSFHVPAPTYAVSGLLCSIDGYPSTGCGTETGAGYAYWSYWHGGSHWTYANVGPAEWVVGNGDVEGWRYQAHGAASPSDPAPDLSPDFATVCADAATSAPPTPTRGVATTGPVTLLLAVGIVVVLLGGLAASRWRRRPSP